ncbi:hypothetical protein ABZ924_11335 [Streptomyces sp. NPDC046876]|uniref:hypothetical protein n=1 Tax=Streptomyces sp. NPDC046876 TaxID=3155616 RepID=UPI003405F170
MTPDEATTHAGPASLADPASEDQSPDGDVLHTELEHDISELIDAIAGSSGGPGPSVYAPYANINTGAVHGGQRVHNASSNEGRTAQAARVHEGPIPDTEVEAAAFGFAEPDGFGTALTELDKGLLFLTGRPGSGRRTAALNLLRRVCGYGAPLRALDSVTELDRWRPTDGDARGYLVDGLFPARPLGPGVLGHIRSLLEKANAYMVIVLPDDEALLRRVEQDLHVSPISCDPPPPSVVFGSRFEAVAPDQHERERLLDALGRDLLGELLVPELVPAEVVELVTAIVSADGNPSELGDLRARLSYRAEQEVPELLQQLRADPDGLAFLLATCVYEGLDHRIVREEADRLLELSDGRLTEMLPPADTQGTEKRDRPNREFVFRRPLTDLLRAIRASRQPREIRTGGAYLHTVEPVAFVRHGQAEAVLRHVWREYGQLSALLVTWMRNVERDSELTLPVGRVMGMAASWGGGRRALRHLQALADSERTTSRLIAAHALGIAAEDPVLVAEVRYRLHRWSLAASPHLRTTVAYACGAAFGLSRPDVALRLLRTLLLGAVGGDVQEDKGEARVGLALRAAIVRLFQAGNEQNVVDQLLSWLRENQAAKEQLLVMFGQLLEYPRWFQQELASRTAYGRLIAEAIQQALNAEGSFEVTCAALLRWSALARWDEVAAQAVEHLYSTLSGFMQHGAFRLFVELDQGDTDGWVGRDIARDALNGWRNGAQRGAA